MSGGSRSPSGAGDESYVLFDRVWKKFHRGEFHDSLRDLIPDLARRLLGRGPDRNELDEGDFWALRDVSFKVRPGEALGIIGPNGAGKSTVLKVLTRILRPNRGRSEVKGRIGALIEVAAGFHPDLTGAENIYLQGSIMGMRTEEIDRKFDEIVEFAGIPDFVDTQVKRYSSGMNARLGFAIAAHMDPEVLIIDEVLAVGDFAFQRKAFKRMAEIVQRDIPVVVVSHQLDRIASLCSKAILLDRGRVTARGSPGEVINAYVEGQTASELAERDAPIVLDRVTLQSEQPVRSGEPVQLRIDGRIAEPDACEHLAIAIRIRQSETGQTMYATDTTRLEEGLPPGGAFRMDVRFEANVHPGIYAIESLVWNHQTQEPVASGPGSYLRVSEGPSFFGVAQCRAEIHIRAQDDAVAGV